MYKYVILFCLVGFSAFAQAPSIIWDKTIGGGWNDLIGGVINNEHIGIPIVINNDGGFTVACSSESNISGDKSADRRGGTDYWVLRYNSIGQKIWDRTFGGSENEQVTSIVATNDGGYIISGSSWSGISGDKTVPNKGNRINFWLVKVSGSGEKIWDRAFGADFDFDPLIIATNDGGYIVAGTSFSGISGDKTGASRGEADYWIIKINNNGEKIWDRTYGGSSNDRVSSITATNDGGFVIVGTSSSGISGDKTEVSRGSTDYWAVKITSTGQKVWDKTLGGVGNEECAAVVNTNDDGVVIVGSSNSDMSGDKSENNKGPYENYRDYWVVKLTKGGQKVWDKTLGGQGPSTSGSDIAQSIIATNDGSFIISGTSNSTNTDDKSEYDRLTDNDYWILKINSVGQKIWDKTIFGSRKWDRWPTIVETNDGGIIIVGESDSNAIFDKTEDSKGGDDLWIIKLGTETVSTNTVSLSTPLRFGGGLSTLNVGTGYNLTASLKNSSNTTWEGAIYLRVNNGTPMLLQANQGIGAGSTLNFSDSFQPQAAQIGANVPIELLTKQGSGDFVRVAAVNGTVNPVLVNIEAASNVPVVRVPFIRLNTSQISPGGTVEIAGGNFEPGTQVVLQSSPNIPDANYPSQIAGPDGSINVSLTVPTTFKEPYLTLIAHDTHNNNPTASVKVPQPVRYGEIVVLTPNARQAINGNVYVGYGEKDLSITWSDLIVKGAEYEMEGAKRKVKYRVDFEYFGTGQVVNLTTMTNKEFLNTTPRMTTYLEVIDLVLKLGGNNVNSADGYIKVTDIYKPERSAKSDRVKLIWQTSESNYVTLEKKWDLSFKRLRGTEGDDGFIASTPIRGIAADGVSRFYLKAAFTDDANAPNVQSVKITLEDPNDLSNRDPTWLGRVMYADQSKLGTYSLEANGINQIIAQSVQPNVNREYYFWYVAPDDFSHTATDKINRMITAKVEIKYEGIQTTELREVPIVIVRPPIMFVHGWMGDKKSFEDMDVDPRFQAGWYVRNKNMMLPYASFDENSKILLGLNESNYASSFQAVVSDMRKAGFVSTQVDYVCHSMGGLMLRNILSQRDNDLNIDLEKEFFQTDQSQTYDSKNYQKGWVHKYITINTPHFGSPGADLIAGVLPIAEGVLIRKIKNIENILSDEWLNYFHGVIDTKDGKVKASEAVIDMQTNKYSDGKTNFNRLDKVKSHTIFSDIDTGFEEYNPQNYSDFYSDLYAGLNKGFNKYWGILLFSVAKQVASVEPDITLSPLFSDFIIKNRTQLTNLWKQYDNSHVNEMMVNYNPGGLAVLGETMRLWGLYNGKYADYLWNSDAIVPNLSQISSLPLTATNVSLISNTKQTDFTRFHVGIQSQMPTVDRVYQLLNGSVNSNIFGALEGNSNPQRDLSNAPNKNKRMSATVALDSGNGPKEEYDRSKIKIVSPVSSSALDINTVLNIIVQALDTVNLKKVELIGGGDVLINSNRLNTYTFSLSGQNFNLYESNQIMAVGYYFIDDEYYLKLDTVSLNVTTTSNPEDFSVEPLSTLVPIESNLNPRYLVSYPTFLSSKIDFTKLNVSISNPACLTYDAQTGQFKGTQKGEAVVIFTYDGNFKDTMYVAVGGGGVPYPQQIQTANVPVTGDGTICTGATISVPFTTSGGAFDEGNQFIVQLSDASGENFTSLETTGTSSPLSARIPNGLANADTYKVRVVSLSPPVLGTVAAQPLKIRSCETQGNFTITGPEVLCQGETITLTATGCAGTVSWSTGSTSASITVSPTATTTYLATCTVGNGKTVASISPVVAPNITISSNEGTCFDGNVTLTASGLPSGGSLLWKRDGTLIPNATTVTYQATQPGTYTAEPQAEAWTWQNPLPDGEDLKDIFFVSDLVGVAVGNRGKIVRTTDGGETWSMVPLTGKENLTSVHFITNSVGWVVGQGNSIRKTTDGGLTWNSIPLPSSYYNSDEVQFTDSNHGWLLANYNKVLRTTDGGTTWEELNPNVSSTLTGLFFTDNSTGWAVGYNGTVRRTSNGGNSWTTVSLGNADSFNDVFFVDANNGWISGSGGVYKTSDGGRNWTNQKAAFPPNTVFYKIYFSDPANGIVANNQGLHKTSDGGATWIPTTNSEIAGFGTDIFMRSPTKAWAAGKGGRIVTGQFVNSAFTWKITEGGSVFGPNSMHTMDFVDANTGWAGGENGYLRKTVNGGNSWTETSLSGAVEVDFIDTNTGYAIVQQSGLPEAIHKSTDGGNSWNKVYDLPGGSNKMQFKDTNTGWFANYSLVHRTTDGGSNWSASNVGFGVLYLFFVNTTTGWAGGYNGEFAKTTDGGATWTNLTTNVGAMGQMKGMYFKNSTDGWISSYTSSIRKTTDGGLTWTAATIPGSPQVFESMDFADQNNGIALSNSISNTDGIIGYKTKDGGTNWTLFYIPTQSLTYGEVIFPDPSSAWVSNGSGSIMHYSVTASACSSNAITLNAAPAAPAVSSSTISSGQTATLTASGCSGTVNWYNAASGGASLNTGSSFTTPVLTATTIYYASCTVDNCESTTRGTGTVTVGSGGFVISIKSGSWHDPSTWDCNCVPNNTHTVEIKQTHTVTVSTADANLKDLKFSSGNLDFQNQKKLCFGCN